MVLFVTVTPNVKKCINDVYEVVYWEHFAVVGFDASYFGLWEQIWGIKWEIVPYSVKKGPNFPNFQILNVFFLSTLELNRRISIGKVVYQQND